MRGDVRSVEFDDHRLAFLDEGSGPALVVLSQYWRSEDLALVRLLGERYRLFHITPVGYGKSDRVPGYAGELLVDQVHAVLDRFDVDRFVVMGYSAGGAMAACVARASDRAVGLVCGGFCPLDAMTPAKLRVLDRRLRSDHASRSLWWWIGSLDWRAELAGMRCARLLYWGSEDRQMARGLQRAEADASFQDVDFIAFGGRDHRGCNTHAALEREVVPAIADWLERRLDGSW